MTSGVRFWLLHLARGLTALVAGMGILILPDMARSLILLPLSVLISVLVLGGYGVLDSLILIASSALVAPRFARLGLLLQGLAGLVVGCLLLLVVYERAELVWFLTIIAAQALATGVAELLVASHAAEHSASRWNYAGAILGFLFAAAYLALRVAFSRALTMFELSRLIFAYLLVFGLAQCLTALRMLYAISRPMLPNGTAGARA